MTAQQEWEAALLEANGKARERIKRESWIEIEPVAEPDDCVTPLIRAWANRVEPLAPCPVVGIGTFGPNPASPPAGATRLDVLKGLWLKAAGRSVYGTDSRGHGGIVTPDNRMTDGWCVPVGSLVYAEIEGIPGSRIRLPQPERTVTDGDERDSTGEPETPGAENSKPR